MVTFLDSNVWLYATGPDDPNRPRARAHLDTVADDPGRCVTSTEVVQEVLHVAARRDDLARFDAALMLIDDLATVWSLELDDVRLARRLADQYRHLGGRDLVHLAMCLRRDVDELVTFDRALATAWDHR